MAISIFEYSDQDPQGSGIVVQPPVQRRVNLGVGAGVYHEIGVVATTTNPLVPTPICFEVYTDAAAHIRIIEGLATNPTSPTHDAVQTDRHLAADSTTLFVIRRKTRGLTDGVGPNRFWINVIADT